MSKKVTDHLFQAWKKFEHLKKNWAALSVRRQYVAEQLTEINQLLYSARTMWEQDLDAEPCYAIGTPDNGFWAMVFGPSPNLVEMLDFNPTLCYGDGIHSLEGKRICILSYNEEGDPQPIRVWDWDKQEWLQEAVA